MKTQKKINAISLSNHYSEIYLFRKFMLGNVLFLGENCTGGGGTLIIRLRLFFLGSKF